MTGAHMLVDDGIICLLWEIEDYPKVERKPETDPSAYREIMSPMWRKEAVPAISMFQIWPNLLMNSQTYDLPHFEFPYTPSIPSGFAVELYHNITMTCCPLPLLSQADITYIEWNYIHMIPYSEVLGHILQLRILSPLISRHVEAFFFKSSRHFFPNLSPLFLQSHFFPAHQLLPPLISSCSPPFPPCVCLKAKNVVNKLYEWFWSIYGAGWLLVML